MTRLERWIYRDLIEVYYDTERPLTTDVDVLCKDIGVRSEEEKSIVRGILEYKFSLTARGYEHKRCEETIGIYHAKADIARENGKKGGRPKKPVHNQEKPTGFVQVSELNQSLTEGKANKTGSKANQKPETSNQEPIKEGAASAPLSVEDLVSDGLPSDLAQEFIDARKKQKAPLTLRAWNAIKREAEKASWTLAAVIERCLEKGWRGFEAEWVQKEQAAEPRNTPPKGLVIPPGATWMPGKGIVW